jgi:hypothetical protein
MKVKIIKRPKRVDMYYEEIKSYISQYTCPSCFVTIRGAQISLDIVRFKCECGQELIVDKRIMN